MSPALSSFKCSVAKELLFNEIEVGFPELSNEVGIINGKQEFNSKNDIYNPSTPDNIFNFYLANKVLESVLDTETELNKRRTYEVKVSKSKYNHYSP